MCFCNWQPTKPLTPLSAHSRRVRRLSLEKYLIFSFVSTLQDPQIFSWGNSQYLLLFVCTLQVPRYLISTQYHSQITWFTSLHSLLEVLFLTHLKTCYGPTPGGENSGVETYSKRAENGHISTIYLWGLTFKINIEHKMNI